MLADPSSVRRTVVSAANPATKLAAAFTITIAVMISLDVVSAGVAVALEVAVLPWAGVPARTLARLLTPIAGTALLAGALTTVIGLDAGETLWAAGPFDVTQGSAHLAAAIVLRVLAIGLPGVALLGSTDPTDLADALAQRLRLPARFVLGALAALRLVSVLIAQWQVLTMARRARGLGDSVGLLGRMRVLGGQTFALLVLAVRRGTRLATAMEGRGFGSPRPRTWARPSTFGWRDAVVAGGAIVIAAACTSAAILAGTWSFVLA